MAMEGQSIPQVRRRDWEDPMTVEWNKRHAHVPLHCHTTVEGTKLQSFKAFLPSALSFCKASVET